MNKLFGKIFNSAHSGGYVLITAVSAVLLVSVASAAIISSSYISLSRQIKSFDYMKSKYEAEGQIEALQGYDISEYENFKESVYFIDGVQDYRFVDGEAPDFAYAFIQMFNSGFDFVVCAYSSDHDLCLIADIIVEENIDGETVFTYREYYVLTDFNDEE